MRILPLVLLLFCQIWGVSAEPKFLMVPQSPTVPMLIDGRIEQAEWSGAAEVEVAEGVNLLVKQSGGHLYIAVNMPDETPQPLDLYLVPADAAVMQLHASMQLGERRPTSAEPSPAWRWGNNTGWTASTLKRDPERAGQAHFAQQLYVADGVEMQIDRRRFPGAAWRVRLTIDAIPGNDRAFSYPQDATDEPSSWAIWQLDPPVAEAQLLKIEGEDGITVFADLYAHPNPKAPIILAAHRALWSRGEYAPIADWFNALGFQLVAIDQRSGWEVNGVRNQTAAQARSADLPTGFFDAKADIESALAHVATAYPGRPLLLMGSSYSSALALRIAGENHHQLSAVIAFAPGEYFQDKQYIQQVSAHIAIPTFITSARHELALWQPFARQISPPLLTDFLPETPGRHGAQALWSGSEGYEEYRAALAAFLAPFVD